MAPYCWCLVWRHSAQPAASLHLPRGGSVMLGPFRDEAVFPSLRDNVRYGGKVHLQCNKFPPSWQIFASCSGHNHGSVYKLCCTVGPLFRLPRQIYEETSSTEIKERRLRMHLLENRGNWGRNKKHRNKKHKKTRIPNIPPCRLLYVNSFQYTFTHF